MMCIFFMLGNSFYVFWCADSIFCGDGRFRNPDVKNSYRVQFVPCLVVLYPQSTIQYPVPRVLILQQYVCITALHLVPPAVASWLSPSWQHLHLSPFVAHFNLSQLFFVAIVDKVVTFFTFLKRDSTAKTKTACKRSWHQSPARILRLVVVCLHVVPYWRRSLTRLGWLSDLKSQTVLRN